MITQAVLTARLNRITPRFITDATKGERPLSKRKQRQLKRRFNAALREMTLDTYVAWCNRDAEGFALMGADQWRARGITTAVDLGRLLDAEHRRNMEKEERYG